MSTERGSKSKPIILIIIIILLISLLICLCGLVVIVYNSGDTNNNEPSREQIQDALRELINPTLTQDQDLIPTTPIRKEVDVTEYKNNVESYLQRFVIAANNAADLGDQMGYDASLFYDQTWKSNMFYEMDEMVYTLCSVANLDYPSSFSSFHSYMQQACSEEKLYREKLKSGISNSDLEMADAALVNLDNVNYLLEQAVAEYKLH
jgi:hypothetical protein